MKPVTLITRRLYFGVDAMRLREAAGRVLARLDGLPPDQATVPLDVLVADFRVSAAVSRPMIDQMVREGLLQRHDDLGREFGVTDKFRRYAEARIVEPLPRSRARLLVDHVADLAWQFNRTASSNKYEIEAVAVFGGYMSRDPDLAELSIGVTGRRRQPAARPSAGRATVPTEGHEEIRRLFDGQSSFIETHFYRHVQDVPRPFSVIFKSEV